VLACQFDLGAQSTVHAFSDHMETIETKRHGTELLSLRQTSRNRPDDYQQERPQPKTKQAVPLTMLRESLPGITFLDVATRRFIFRKRSQPEAYRVLYELFFSGMAQLPILFHEDFNLVKKLRLSPTSGVFSRIRLILLQRANRTFFHKL